MTTLSLVALGACLVTTVCADLRWLRVAQREHYLAGAGLRFWWRWATAAPINTALAVIAAAGAAGSAFAPGAALATAGVTAIWPVGLGLRGRTSSLAWTRRMTSVALVTVVLQSVVIAAAGVLGGLSVAVVFAACVAFGSAALVDVALFILRPVEDLLARRFVRSTHEVLAQVRPLVVGITGSFGKTTTKNYVAHLLAGDRIVVSSPRSFNNRAGLTRTVNENLAPGTEVMVAEMGAYGAGEIAELCSWLRPEIAVITSIGPAHLERFGTLERTLAAKAEIVTGARIAVLNVDDTRLDALAKRLAAAHKVVRVSGSDRTADVAVIAHDEGLELWVAGQPAGVAVLTPEAAAPIRTNAACAAAVALELGIGTEAVAKRLGSLPGVPNRLQRHNAERGYSVLDDTFNSNPAGARHALDVLVSLAPSGRRMLVTPGIAELGPSQPEENTAFGEIAAAVVTDLVVVGRTNRDAIVQGWRKSVTAPALKLVNTRDEAVAWARAQLGPDDAVLFENDLPDHFP